jgi:CMP-N,N'-diacetyllegionaminic acid synthase
MLRRLALVPARAGSKRVLNKNIRVLRGHPLIAYAIASARASGCFDRVVVSTDSEVIRQVALHYGADVPFLRPVDIASSTSPDIEWITHALAQLDETYDALGIVRATNPFRGAAAIRRGWEQFLNQPGIDSLRAVELCKQHPGKMWVLDGQLMRPFLDQSHLEVAWHAMQYPSLPPVYVQNSSLEIVWVRAIRETNTKEGRIIAPFLSNGLEGFNIDYEDDLMMAEHLLSNSKASVAEIEVEPFPLDQLA